MGFDMNGIVPTLPINNNGNNDGFGFGAGGGWIVFLIIAMMFGWGGNGFGNRAGGNAATTEDLANGFAQNSILRNLGGLERGLCDLGYQNAQLAAGVKEAVTSGIFATQTGFNMLGSKMDACCCETQRSIDGVKYQMATDTCAIITNQNQNANAIEAAIGKLACDLKTQSLEQEIARLNRENHDKEIRELELKGQISQNNQTTAILAAVKAMIDGKATTPTA